MGFDHEAIRTAATCQAIPAVPTIHNILAVQAIESFPERRIGIHRVTAEQQIVAVRADELFHTLQLVTLGSAAHTRSARKVDRHPGPRVVVAHGIESGAPIQRIGAVAADQQVVPIPSVKLVVGLSTRQRIATAMARKHIIADTTDQFVVGIAAGEHKTGLLERRAHRHIGHPRWQHEVRGSEQAWRDAEHVEHPSAGQFNGRVSATLPQHHGAHGQVLKHDSFRRIADIEVVDKNRLLRRYRIRVACIASVDIHAIDIGLQRSIWCLEEIAAALAEKMLGAGGELQPVVAGSADQDVIAVIAEQHVVTSVADQDIVASANTPYALDPGVAIARGNAAGATAK